MRRHTILLMIATAFVAACSKPVSKPVATQGTSSSNWAKYAIGVTASPMSFTLTPAVIRPVTSAILIEDE